MTVHPAITISRSLGSGGTEVGFLLARQPGVALVDRTILRQAAQALGLTCASLGPQEERHSGFLERLLSTMTLATPEAPYTPRSTCRSTAATCSRWSGTSCARWCGSTRRCWWAGPASSRSRTTRRPCTCGSSRRCRSGPSSWWAGARRRTSRPRAGLIEDSDRNRAAFVRGLTGRDWNNTGNFQLVLDSSRLGLEGCMARIAEEAKLRF